MRKQGPMFIMVYRCTSACNFNCLYCSFRGGDLPKDPTPDELNTKSAFEMVDKIYDFGATWFGLSGGEPLMRKDVFDIVEHAKNLGLRVSLITNGSLVEGWAYDKLVKDEVMTSVSLDGSEEVQDKLRGKGAYKSILAAVRKLSEAGILDCLVTTTTTHNCGDIDHLVDLAKEYKARRVVVHNFVPTGSGKYNIDLVPSPEQYEWTWNHVFDLFQTNRGKLDIKVYSPFFARVVRQRGLSNFWDWYTTEHLGRCTMDGHYISIMPNGDIKPCGFNEHLKLGNIKEKNLEELWNELQTGEFFLKLRDKSNLKGKCGICEYREICGGCRTRAEYYTGDLFQSDPACAYIPKALREK